MKTNFNIFIRRLILSAFVLFSGNLYAQDPIQSVTDYLDGRIVNSNEAIQPLFVGSRVEILKRINAVENKIENTEVTDEEMRGKIAFLMDALDSAIDEYNQNLADSHKLDPWIGIAIGGALGLTSGLYASYRIAATLETGTLKTYVVTTSISTAGGAYLGYMLEDAINSEDGMSYPTFKSTSLNSKIDEGLTPEEVIERFANDEISAQQVADYVAEDFEKRWSEVIEIFKRDYHVDYERRDRRMAMELKHFIKVKINQHNARVFKRLSRFNWIGAVSGGALGLGIGYSSFTSRWVLVPSIAGGVPLGFLAGKMIGKWTGDDPLTIKTKID